MINHWQDSKIIKTLIKFAKFAIPLFLFGLWAPDTFAAAAQEFRQDASTAFLSVLFGGVSAAQGMIAVLGRESNFMGLGVAFRYYNIAIAVVGVVVVTYITVVALMNSAHSGNPMGKWHSMFLPIRVVVGAGLLIPNSFGYNLAQVTMMWFILSGVQIADRVWDYVTAYWEQPRPAQTDDTPTVSNQDIVNHYGATARFAICVGMSGVDSYPATPNVNSFQCANNNCKTASTIDPTDPAALAKCGKLQINPQGSLSGDSRDAYMKNLISDIISPIVDKIRIAAQGNVANISPEQQQQIVASTWSTMQYGMVLAEDIVRNQKLTELIDSNTGKYATERRIGWMAAGASYYKYIKNMGDSAQGTVDYVTDYISPPTWSGSSASTGGPSLDTTIINNIQSNYVDAPASTSEANQQLALDVPLPYQDNVVMGFIYKGIKPLLKIVRENIFDPMDFFGYTQNINILSRAQIEANLKEEPLRGISKAGSKILVGCEIAFGVIFIALVVTSAAAGAAGVTFLGSGAGAGATIAILVPVAIGVLTAILAILTAFYPIGMIMNIYIPLIPLVIYTFGVIGWFLLCVEAMAAAPIVALGLMHPEQNDVLGKAEHGLVLILNLMLRPVLMVVGLVAAIVLVRLVLLFFTWSFNMVIGSGLMKIEAIGSVVILLFVYTWTLTVLIQKSFSLINAVPDRLMSWIGSQAGGVGEATEFLSGSREGTDKGGKVATDSAKGAKTGYASGFKAGEKSISTNRPPSDSGSIS